MESQVAEKPVAMAKEVAEKTVFSILLSISFSHMLNDTIQSLIPSIYPIVKDSFHLSFGQIGLITFIFQLTASLFQPLVGYYTDRKPQPYSLAVGMLFTLTGLILLSQVHNFGLLLLSVAIIGTGSSVFHPEASKVAFMASGGRRGLAQSIFQVGGNFGGSLGPLLAAIIIVPFGQPSIIWFSILAFIAIVVLYSIGNWYSHHIHRIKRKQVAERKNRPLLSPSRIAISIFILLVLIFSKYFYLASISSYYTFYLMHKFHVSVQGSQIHLFIFLLAGAAGTLLGGPIGDRFGRKYVIWFSILGVAPFTLLLPYVNLFWTTVLSMLIGVILASAFSAILVYAQELLPGKVGMISGLFFGFAFGMGGLGSAVLGALADRTSIDFVYKVCSFLPLMGVITVFLPRLDIRR